MYVCVLSDHGGNDISYLSSFGTFVMLKQNENGLTDVHAFLAHLSRQAHKVSL